MERDYDVVSAEDARQEFEYDGRVMDEESERTPSDAEGSRTVRWHVDCGRACSCESGFDNDSQ